MRTDLPAWRSLLFCPVNVERFVAKAHTRGADAIILDLEDAIAPAEKALARGEGAVAFEGQMVDLPVAERARRLIARAQCYARGKSNTSHGGA
jgi:citrate lyase beta subunit